MTVLMELPVQGEDRRKRSATPLTTDHFSPAYSNTRYFGD